MALPPYARVPVSETISSALGAGAPAPARPWFPLNRVRAGCVVIVKQLTATPEVNQRLREMGFGEEQRVKVITLQNNVLCQVCNARLGLSAALAASILVVPAEPVRLAA